MTTRRVIKVGTSLLRGDPSRSTEQVIADLASSLSGLWQRGEPVALVTSGAVGLGCHALGQTQRPSEVEALQAAADSLVAGKPGALDGFKTAVNCKACHSVHKGD